MKKEFKELLACKHATVQITELAWLKRWTNDGYPEFNPVDRLVIEFNSPTGARTFYTGEIVSRDTEGIAREIAEHTKAFAQKWAETEANRMIAGKMMFKFHVKEEKE